MNSETIARVTPLREPDPEPPIAPPLPANIEAEQGLLGAILVNNKAYERVAGSLRAEDFSNAMHARLYAAIGLLIDAGRPADAVMLRRQFEQDPALVEFAGGAGGYLAQLIGSVASVTNAPYYAEAIVDAARRRDLIVAGQDLVTAAYTADLERPARVILAEHESAIDAIDTASQDRGGARSLADNIAAALKRSEAAYRADGKPPGVPTGFTDLDRKLGGLIPGDLIFLGGRPSMGKSSISSSIALNAARDGFLPGVFSLEESGEQQAQRILAAESGVGIDRQRRGDLDMLNWDGLVRAAKDLVGVNIITDDTPGLTLPELRRRARAMKRRHGISLLIIDHFYIIRWAGKMVDRRHQVDSIAHSLKDLARELNIPVLCLAQLSRDVDRRENKRPVMPDLPESGAVEAHADTILFLFRLHYYLSREEPNQRSDEGQDRFNDRYDRWKDACDAAEGLAELIVAKNRFGSQGIIRLHWDGALTRFTSYMPWQDRGASA